MLVTGHSVLFKVLQALFFILFSISANPQIFPDKKVDSLLAKGINLLIDQQYNDAKLIFTELDEGFPQLPFGKIYLAAADISYAYDFELPFNEAYIEKNLKQAQIISEELLSKNQNDIWNVYLFGLVRGYTAYYYALKGNWFDGFLSGRSAITAFEKCLEMDSSFSEALIALGTYEYWKSRKTEFLNWIPFIEDERESGIEKLKLAIESASYNRHIAIHSLIWIYIDQQKYKAAFELSNYALKNHPSSRIFKWGLARSLEEFDPQKSIEVYFDLLESYKKTGIRTKVNEITLKHVMAQQYVKLGNDKEVKKLCLAILNTNDLTIFEKEKLEDRLKRVKKLLSEINAE